MTHDQRPPKTDDQLIQHDVVDFWRTSIVGWLLVCGVQQPSAASPKNQQRLVAEDRLSTPMSHMMWLIGVCTSSHFHVKMSFVHGPLGALFALYCQGQVVLSRKIIGSLSINILRPCMNWLRSFYLKSGVSWVNKLIVFPLCGRQLHQLQKEYHQTYNRRREAYTSSAPFILLYLWSWCVIHCHKRQRAYYHTPPLPSKVNKVSQASEHFCPSAWWELSYSFSLLWELSLALSSATEVRTLKEGLY